MIKDRIKDLPINFINNEDQNQTHNTNNQSTAINIDNGSHIIEFLDEVEEIRSVIDKIDELAQQVKRIHIEMLLPTANPKLEREYDDKTGEITKLAYKALTKLKKLKETEENRGDWDQTNAQWRIKESQIFVLTRRFRDTMIEYNKETVTHRDRCKKVIVRELDMSGQRKNHDELEDMLESGFPGTFNFSILVSTQKAQQSLDEIEARHHDIIKLENSIRELHNMFLDLAVLVADQGEMIDSIEHNVSKAKEYVEIASGDVKTVEQYDKKIQKKKILILIILLASVVLLIIFIFSGYFIEKAIRQR